MFTLLYRSNGKTFGTSLRPLTLLLVICDRDWSNELVSSRSAFFNGWHR